jgi:lipid II:glycine glycyltransferase (peptidoglycan interpeptide bridge formation enzyme)
MSRKTTWQIDPLQDPRWAEFVQNHPRASVFHTPEWLGALRRTYGHEPVIITTAAPAENLCDGLVFCRVRSWLTGSRCVSIPFSDHCEPLVDSPDVLSDVLSAGKRDLDANGGRYLEIRPITLTADCSRTLTPAGCYCLHQLHLGPSLEILFRSFHKDCIQRKILRAEREALTYEEGRSERLLDQFYNLMVLTRRRHRLVPQPRSWFLNLVSGMGEMLKIRVASKFGRPVAAILTLRYRDTLVYKYGCSDRSFSNLGGMQLVLWESIQDAKREGLAVFDFGRSDWEDTGLIIFKDRWGAKRSEITYLRLLGPTQSKGIYRAAGADWKARVAQRIFPHLPDRILCAAGDLIYRHLG